ncbi:uncharacterized protein F5891DRAFT_985843 [Suillus fuscotomentosus]|uniref:Cyclin N-terminal domain-containing protein n=1 Tax=Suillus fuscotomentosus TaxID=1912939 RepID=A0AAD4DVQ5_9AGAM|nr:uncharacterized protein F5891DRAFT_985843 [Suillus fuscotomentosus]KAG1893493.1 hypothetical protein F5891DRAFT_985843 [Suillus fuscotomentosus]
MSSDAPKTDIDEQTQHEAEVAAVLDVDVAPEADLDGDEWGDLDAEDFDDPLMVSKYVVEIFKYMKQTELITLPHPKYMASQKELAWSMRGILLNWLVAVHPENNRLELELSEPDALPAPHTQIG